MQRDYVVRATGQLPARLVGCNGANGTPDMRDRVPYGVRAVARGCPPMVGNSMTLAPAHMPVHNHGVNDPGHAHGVNDPGHGHGVSDPTHAHSLPNSGSVQAGADNGGAQCPVPTGDPSGRTQGPTSFNGTGVGINASGTNISIYGAGTGIWLSNAGSGCGVRYAPGVVLVLFHHESLSDEAAMLTIVRGSYFQAGGRFLPTAHRATRAE